MLKLLASVVLVPTLAIATPAAFNGPPSTGFGSDCTETAFSFKIILPASKIKVFVFSITVRATFLNKGIFLSTLYLKDEIKLITFY